MAKKSSTARKTPAKRRPVGPRERHAPPDQLRVDPGAPQSVVHMIGFGPDGRDEERTYDLARLHELRTQWPVTWIHVVGLGGAALISDLGREFELHPLALADVVQTHQRPKVERFGTVVQIVIRIVDDIGSPDTEQLSVFIGPGFVVSFEERKGDIFEVVRQRIREGSVRVCASGSDFLAYALLDVAVDAFFPVLEAISEELENIEDLIAESKPLELTGRMRKVKQQLLGLRRALWPMREVLGALATDESTVIRDETRTYLRDCQGHCAQLIDIVTTNRELATDLADLQLSVAGQRLNEVMKVLTVMATLFIPLTFICSVYGMNFDTERSPLNMPELKWFYGYPFALGLMFATAAGLMVFFRRKGWL
ncbi:MAG: magnesium/cobalt transporter CorA [Deltaproteobacteria bacterium]|nr:magnesium/cobalt transporter CorA [Nannocystaceae bacterium]